MKVTIEEIYHFYQTEEEGGEKKLVFKQELDLPFAPFFGLTLVFKSKDKTKYPDDDEFTISTSNKNQYNSIDYIVEDNEFNVVCITSSPWLDKNYKNTLFPEYTSTIEEEIEYMENFGWKLIEKLI